MKEVDVVAQPSAPSQSSESGFEFFLGNSEEADDQFASPELFTISQLSSGNNFSSYFDPPDDSMPSNAATFDPKSFDSMSFGNLD